MSSDALLAALLGAAAETLGLAAAFPAPGESPRQTLSRIRPRVVLVDCDSDGACAADVLGPATMLCAGLVFFGPAAAVERRRELAARHRAVLLTMPATVEEIGEAVRRAMRE